MAEHHHHADEHHHHHPAPGGKTGNTLQLATALTVAFAAVEALGEWWTGSLALLSDADKFGIDHVTLQPETAQRPPVFRR